MSTLESLLLKTLMVLLRGVAVVCCRLSGWLHSVESAQVEGCG